MRHGYVYQGRDYKPSTPQFQPKGTQRNFSDGRQRGGQDPSTLGRDLRLVFLLCQFSPLYFAFSFSVWWLTLPSFPNWGIQNIPTVARPEILPACGRPFEGVILIRLHTPGLRDQSYQSFTGAEITELCSALCTLEPWKISSNNWEFVLHSGA